ncbi:divergent polysaccharide deacetylase family protein [Halalkalibacter krulwichiae]|uniref:Divergent polysaccharide deacetylase n=1 Tax=Halalkalibacter krulwichiae TaxID=199441 RepID=A0A1X9M7Q5_9BACI|nr:divergent polysaccharide deacetylase family protein [Halalkalibacter krulwichiae]ARK29447.1 Divergent polysaccharide deacetylase [Halalkalibacter krulwichiae]
MRSYALLLTSLISLFTLCTIPNAWANEHGLAAIIIDDFGGDVKGVESFLKGDLPITVAIMPFMEHSTEQAEKAHHAGLEVMIHMPMEPKKGKASWLGPNAITSDLSDEEVINRVEAAIDNVPHAKGINNHMGSKIVEDERIMKLILQTAKDNHLYVVDSGTSSKSVIPALAEQLKIPYATRSIFLDDTHSSSQHVQKQMTSLLKLAKKNKKAIGIGHVGIKGNETYAGIERTVPLFTKEQIDIVPLSHLLDTDIDHDPAEFWKPRKEKSIGEIK